MKRMVFMPALMVMALGVAESGETKRSDHFNQSDKAVNPDLATVGLSVADISVVDYCAYSGIGEDNGGIDPGETAAWTFALKNNLTFPLTGVVATLISNNPELVILQGTTTYPDLPVGETANSTEPFWIQKASDAGSYSPLLLRIEAEQGSWDISNYSASCNISSYPLRRNFEVWPLNGWALHGDPNFGGWKSNEDWSHANATGGKGLCAEGIALPEGWGSWQELWTPVIDFGQGFDYWGINFLSNFQGDDGGGAAYVDLSTDGGTSWTTFGVDSTNDPPSGHEAYYSIPISEPTHQAIVRFRLFSGLQGASWQIDQLYFSWSGGGPAGPVGSTCVPCTPLPPCNTPEDAQLLSPQDGITGVWTEIMLSWQPADLAEHYEIYAGPRMGQFNLMGTTTDTSFLLTGLAEATRYEWMISAINECGFNHSAVRSFTTAGGESDGGHDRPVSPP